MEATVLTFPLFSLGGQPATAKFLVLGIADGASLVGDFRSLNSEHVSAAELVQQEISRRTPLGQQAQQARARSSAVPDETMAAVLRKWFWARKPDAGFVLTGFPATLLQAKVLDEWLEARGEALTAVIAVSDSPIADLSLIDYYRTYGVEVIDADNGNA